MNLSDLMSNLGAVIGIVCGCGIGLIAIGLSGYLIFRMMRGQAQTRNLLQTGTPAQAVIVSIQDTGVLINHEPQARVTFQVTPPDRPPFQAVITQTFSPFDLGSLVPGGMAQLRFDPNDISKIAIESLGGGGGMVAPSAVPIPGQFTASVMAPPPIAPGVPAMTTADGQPLNPQLQAAMVTQDQYYNQLRSTGIEAKAVVLTCSSMNIRNYNTGWVYDITLDITTPSGEHFQSKTQAAIVDTSQHKYAVGKMVIVRFDPNNKAQCTLVRAVES
ncbi:MAG: hypothetical protein WBW94_08810 [Anaerolineales bacterium]